MVVFHLGGVPKVHIRIVFNSRYALSAGSGRGPVFQRHSLLVSSVRGAVSWAKLRTWAQKKVVVV